MVQKAFLAATMAALVWSVIKMTFCVYAANMNPGHCPSVPLLLLPHSHYETPMYRSRRPATMCLRLTWLVRIDTGYIQRMTTVELACLIGTFGTMGYTLTKRLVKSLNVYSDWPCYPSLVRLNLPPHAHQAEHAHTLLAWMRLHIVARTAKNSGVKTPNSTSNRSSHPTVHCIMPAIHPSRKEKTEKL